MRTCQSEKCDRAACPCRLNYSGATLVDLCCRHADGFMDYLSRLVPPDEGARGLAAWRERHKATHERAQVEIRREFEEDRPCQGCGGRVDSFARWTNGDTGMEGHRQCVDPNDREQMPPTEGDASHASTR